MDMDLNDNVSAQHEYEDMEPVEGVDDFDTENHEVLTAGSVGDSGMEEVEGDYLAPCDRFEASNTKDQARATEMVRVNLRADAPEAMLLTPLTEGESIDKTGRVEGAVCPNPRMSFNLGSMVDRNTLRTSNMAWLRNGSYKVRMLQDGQMVDANELRRSICLVLPDADPLHSLPDLPALLEEDMEEDGNESQIQKQAPPLPTKSPVPYDVKGHCSYVMEEKDPESLETAKKKRGWCSHPRLIFGFSMSLFAIIIIILRFTLWG